MRPKVPDVLEKGRINNGQETTFPGEFYGAFVVKAPTGSILQIIAGAATHWHAAGMPGPAWDHVSVRPHREDRCCTWEEMCWVKSLFWGDDEAVVQYHPPKKNYVNINPFVLHLWRPASVELPMPPTFCV